MEPAVLKMTADTSAVAGVLASLTDAAERFPEFRDVLLGFFESGEEFFSLDGDFVAASGATEFVVRFNPSDALVSLVTAFRARNPDFDLLEHMLSPNPASDVNTPASGGK